MQCREISEARRLGLIEPLSGEKSRVTDEARLIERLAQRLRLRSLPLQAKRRGERGCA
jgi:hypothetical protein